MRAFNRRPGWPLAGEISFELIQHVADSFFPLRKVYQRKCVGNIFRDDFGLPYCIRTFFVSFSTLVNCDTPYWS